MLPGESMRAFIPLVIACLLSGCAVPYMHSLPGSLQGYSEFKLAPDNYEVRFGTNMLNDRGFAANAVFYRAAQIAKRQGYTHFQVYDANVYLVYTTISYNYVPGPRFRDGDWLMIYVKLVNDPNQAFTCHAERRETCRVFAAAEVLESLGPIVSGKSARKR